MKDVKFYESVGETGRKLFELTGMTELCAAETDEETGRHIADFLEEKHNINTDDYIGDPPKLVGLFVMIIAGKLTASN